MGYSLRMSDEMHDWLAGLRASDPAAARLVAEAVAALLSNGAGLGPPLVVSLADSSRRPDLAEALDRSYQRGLDRAQASRVQVAEATAATGRLREQIAGLEPGAVPDDEAAELRRQLARATEAEQRLTEEGAGLQRQVDAFRTRKEVLKATYFAAQAQAAVLESLADAGLAEAGLSEAGLSEAPLDGADHGPRGEELDAAAGKIREIEQDIERELRTAPWSQAGDLGPAAGLMELRPGAPAGGDVTILFAVEPPGSVLLLAVLEGGQARRDHYDEAIWLSSELLLLVRAGQAPEAAARVYEDARAFLGEFFPAGADEIEAAAAALAVANRARMLAELRAGLGFTQAQVAARMNVEAERVSAIERADLGAAEVGAVAGYIEALGGRLEVIADVGGRRVVLR